METAKVMISRNNTTSIDKRELKSLLSMFSYGYEYTNVIISSEYLQEIIKIAIDGLTEIVEDGLGDLN